MAALSVPNRWGLRPSKPLPELETLQAQLHWALLEELQPHFSKQTPLPNMGSAFWLIRC